MPISLKAARVNCGLTQKEAAERLEISRNTLIKWENGNSSPRVDQLSSICRLYGLSADEILFCPKRSL